MKKHKLILKLKIYPMIFPKSSYFQKMSTTLFYIKKISNKTYNIYFLNFSFYISGSKNKPRKFKNIFIINIFFIYVETLLVKYKVTKRHYVYVYTNQFLNEMIIYSLLLNAMNVYVNKYNPNFVFQLELTSRLYFDPFLMRTN